MLYIAPHFMKSSDGSKTSASKQSHCLERDKQESSDSIAFDQIGNPVEQKHKSH